MYHLPLRFARHNKEMPMKHVFRKNRKKGFTLVELIVTFALLSVFLAACTVSLSSFLKTYGRVNDVQGARVLSDTLMETLAGSMGGAARLTAASPSSLVLSGGEAEYTDGRGYRIKAMLGEGENAGRLVLQYQTMDDEQGEEFATVNWAYKDGVYRDNSVSGLAFAHLNGNCVQVTMTVTNSVTGFAYETRHIVECYNLTDTDITGG